MKYCDITLERVLMHILNVQRHSSMFKIVTIRYEMRLTFSVSHLRGAEFRSDNRSSRPEMFSKTGALRNFA